MPPKRTSRVNRSRNTDTTQSEIEKDKDSNGQKEEKHSDTKATIKTSDNVFENEEEKQTKRRSLRTTTITKTTASDDQSKMASNKRKRTTKSNVRPPTKRQTLETSENQLATESLQNDVNGSDKEVNFGDHTAMESIKGTNKRGNLLTKKKKQSTRCTECFQLENENIIFFPGDILDAKDEEIGLFDPKLLLDGRDVNDLELPDYKITQFSIYDKFGHMCPLDSGLIEKNCKLRISGFVKPVYDDDPSPEGGVPIFMHGGLTEWWVAGYDGGTEVLLGVSTETASYYLMTPTEEYLPFMKSIKEKTYLAKLTIEFLNDDEGGTYEDLINKIQVTAPPLGCESFTEEAMIHHAQFIVEQVDSYDEAADADENLLNNTDCMKTLINLAGVSREEKNYIRARIRAVAKKKPKDSKATTTPLVRNVFEFVFKDQIDGPSPPKSRRKRCGLCEACQKPDCGKCANCKNMLKFNGPGTKKQACIHRNCQNLGYEDQLNDYSDDEIKKTDGKKLSKSRPVKDLVKNGNARTAWSGKKTKSTENKQFYSAVKIDNKTYSVGDYVLVKANREDGQMYVAKIASMWEDKNNKKMFHALWFCPGYETVLGNSCRKDEVFVVDECEDASLTCIYSKCKVTYKSAPDNWKSLGGEDIYEDENVDEKNYFYKLFYDKAYARFEDPPVEHISYEANENMCDVCPSCERLESRRMEELVQLGEKLNETGQVTYQSITHKKIEYCIGSQVFLSPDAFQFKAKNVQTYNNTAEKTVDEESYPEYYRKTRDASDREEFQDPFKIGHITKIYCTSKSSMINPNEIKLEVKKFYRPENTHRGLTASHSADFNLLYWSEEVATVDFSKVEGSCLVSYCNDVNKSDTFWDDDKYHFYFNEAYNADTREFEDPPNKAMRLGSIGKGKGKGKNTEASQNTVEPEQTTHRVLKCMDIFAGCGGLSEGFCQARIAEPLWAVENEETAAQAFKLNNPNCTVFNEDCNGLLRMAMEGRTTNDNGQQLPQKGEVELLCGGPPCQGFSGMNRFTAGQYSQFKNSLIVAYLSYCDFYRPDYFILENVRNFASYKDSLILKLSLKTLVDMGYQCTFGILQAGSYGIPQSRRRTFIFAARPGLILPKFPEPKHIFINTSCQVTVDQVVYASNVQWEKSAPYRLVTVRDTLSDLPPISNGAKTEELTYNPDNQSHFQKILRKNNKTRVIRDHVCKEMNPLVYARIQNIPCEPNADWRDLPNIEVTLSNGNRTKKLEYKYNDSKNGRAMSGDLRGVCPCVDKKCNSQGHEDQDNTLIPWCLPHTGNRHNNWAGLYGRLDPDGYFKTTVTNPEPMGKQGKVLHPTQHRVISVRECARSQGFPDSYKFCGSILDRHRQIGNAVPPPLAREIAVEFKKCLIAEPVKDSAGVDKNTDCESKSNDIDQPGSSRC